MSIFSLKRKDKNPALLGEWRFDKNKPWYTFKKALKKTGTTDVHRQKGERVIRRFRSAIRKNEWFMYHFSNELINWKTGKRFKLPIEEQALRNDYSRIKEGIFKTVFAISDFIVIDDIAKIVYYTPEGYWFISYDTQNKEVIEHYRLPESDDIPGIRYVYFFSDYSYHYISENQQKGILCFLPWQVKAEEE
jgi:hypothetical protein